MEYYIDLFSPETHAGFSNSDQTVSGFRETQRNTAMKIKPGDKFVCYVTKLSRWIGILEIESEHFIDDKPIFYKDNDPFHIRFKVKPTVWLDLEHSIPIHDEFVWNHLSFTKELDKNDTRWTGRVRGSLTKLSKDDGDYLSKILIEQSKALKPYPLTDQDQRKLKSLKVKTTDNREISVSVPENDEEVVTTIKESTKVQSLLANIGERMGMKIWLPRNDRSRVLEAWSPSDNTTVLESLPMNYDDTTLSTIENIDVIWIKGRSIIRAFEVEHTTSIYSGILRMADLMALQPNLDIKAHIVAPSDRREKVLQEIIRPVFSLLEKGPLSDSCTYLSYDSVLELTKEKRLEYMNDQVLEEYAEQASD